MENGLEWLMSLVRIAQDIDMRPRCRRVNVLDAVRVDENTHTRILAGLLREDAVRRSFLELVCREGVTQCVKAGREDRAPTLKELLSLTNIRQVSSADISTFSKYIDTLLVSPGRFAVVIENKVMGAYDQERQIERYIKSVQRCHGLGLSQIVVVYLTREGGEPSESSLGSDVRRQLGGCVPMNYAQHVLPWLRKGVPFTLETFSDRRDLASAIQQYADFLASRFDACPASDPHAPIVDAARGMAERVNPYRMLGHVNHELLSRRRDVCMAALAGDVGVFERVYGNSPAAETKAERQQVLKALFCERLNVVAVEGDDVCCVETGAGFALSLSVTEPEQMGLAYADFCYEGGDALAYQNQLAAYEASLKDSGYADELVIGGLVWQREPSVRCIVNVPDDVLKLISAVEAVAGRKDRISPHIRLDVPCGDDVVNLLRVKNALEKLVAGFDELERNRYGGESDNRSTHYWYGPTGWAWQRGPWQAYGAAAIEVFPKRDVAPDAFERYLAESNEHYPHYVYRWNGGRPVYQFPLSLAEGYERRLTRFLAGWKEEEDFCLPGVDGWCADTGNN